MLSPHRSDPLRRSLAVLTGTVVAVLLLAASVLFVAVPEPVAGQVTPPAERLEMYGRHLDMVEASPFEALAWQHLGPTNISGRVTDVAVVAPRGESYTIYVAGASGGVWKTVNEGVTWEPVFEDGVSTSIGDVTIAPSDADVVWIGTGEANIFRSSMAGAGVYKSTDGGESWAHMGLTGTNTIPRIVIHPTDPDIVYVAASGNEWTFDEDRGLYKTRDGGRNWEKILHISDQTGVIDLVMDPSNPERLYAATWQRIRRKWNDPRIEEGFDESAVYRSEDGGTTWSEVTDGLPEPHFRGRIGIDVAPSNPNVVYAFVDNYEIRRQPEPGETNAYGLPAAPVIKGATVYRSDDRGDSWRRVSEENSYMERLGGTYGWVFGQIRVDPNDENTIYVMGLGLNVSNDAGRTFRPLVGMHGDHHALWIDPDNSDYLVNGNDGGVDISYDGGLNWRNFNDVGLGMVQFFNVGYDMDEPFRVYGSVQDHGSFRGVVDLSRGRHRIPAVEWEGAPGGEGSTHAVDPTDPDIVYSAGFYGRISRTDMETGQTTSVVPQPEPDELPFRGQWIAPFIISPHNPRVIYHGMNYLFRSLDRGDTWERISQDLSHNDIDRLGDIPFQTIYSISESPLEFGLVYAGTDDGRVHLTRSGGLDWAEITEGLVPDRVIAEIVASKYDEATVYLVQNGKRADDFRPHLWKSTDYGETWTSIVNDLPTGPVNVIEEDPVNPEVLYVGTDMSAYVSRDGGSSWQALAAGLPSTFVQDLVVHPRDAILVAATHGRGMFALDVSFFQQMTPEVMAAPLHLFEPMAVELPTSLGGRGGFGGLPEVSVGYWLAEAGRTTLEVQDAVGETVAVLEAPGDPGFNLATWNLRAADGRGRGGGGVAGGRGGGRGGGPIVEPGSYSVVLTQLGRTSRAPLEVVR